MEDTTLPALVSIYTASEFERWLEKSKPGARIEYHRGRLGEDRRNRKNSALDSLAKYALRAAGYRRHRFRDTGVETWASFEKPMVRLLQRRTGPREFAYLAERI